MNLVNKQHVATSVPSKLAGNCLQMRSILLYNVTRSNFLHEPYHGRTTWTPIKLEDKSTKSKPLGQNARKEVNTQIVNGAVCGFSLASINQKKVLIL